MAVSGVTRYGELLKCNPLLAGDRLKFWIRQRTDLGIPHKNPCTGVPPQNRSVIARRTQSFGSFIVFHRLVQSVIGVCAAA